MILTKLTCEECYDQVKLHGWSLFYLEPKFANETIQRQRTPDECLLGAVS